MARLSRDRIRIDYDRSEGNSDLSFERFGIYQILSISLSSSDIPLPCQYLTQKSPGTNPALSLFKSNVLIGSSPFN